MKRSRVERLDVCRAALRIGPLTIDGQAWRFGRRRFGFAAVARLIESGEAVRDGDEARMIDA